MVENINIISFDFEEVNSAVFRNAQIYKRKLVGEYIVCIIVPTKFKGLYKDSDDFILIDDKKLNDFGILSYSDVLDYFKSPNILDRLLNKLCTIAKCNLHKYFPTPRQNKFYIKSGLEKSCLNAAKKRYHSFSYFRGNDSLDIAGGIESNSLEQHFVKQFKYLRDMITDGALYESQNISSEVRKNHNIELYLNHRGHKIVLRTRNFKHKATVHNTKKDILTPLLKSMLSLDKDLLILNIGYPALSFDLPDTNYLEYSDGMSFNDELSLCSYSDYSLMTAEAGLFTAFAASRINLIQYDEEWSMYSLGENKVSLFEARKSNKDIDDVDIRDDISQEKYVDAAKMVFSRIKS